MSARKFFSVVVLLLCFVLPGLSEGSDSNPTVDRIIEFAEKEIILAKGSSTKVEVSVSRLNDEAPANTKLVWSSSNESVATIKNGTIKGIEAGECIVTCMAADDETISASISVSVVIPVQKISLDQKTISLLLGIEKLESIQLAVSISPEDAYYQGVTWSTSNPEIAEVNDQGVVTAVAPGKTTLTVTSEDPFGKKPIAASCQVMVTQGITEITMSESSLTIEKGKKASLSISTNLEGKASPKVIWSSSNENIAKVDKNGNVTAKDSGRCVITCTADDGSETTAECRIAVYDPASGLSAAVAAIDFASFSESELHDIINVAGSTLAERVPNTEEGDIIYEDDKLKILFSDLEISGERLYINCIAENTSSTELVAELETCIVNGWDARYYSNDAQITVPANSKKRGHISLGEFTNMVDIQNVNEIEDIKYTVSIMDHDNYKTIVKADQVHYLDFWQNAGNTSLGITFNDFTEEELRQIITMSRLELIQKDEELNSYPVFYEDGNIKLIVTGVELSLSGEFKMDCIGINPSKYNIHVSMKDCLADGWDVKYYSNDAMVRIESNTIKKVTFSLDKFGEQSGFETLAEINEINCHLTVRDVDKWKTLNDEKVQYSLPFRWFLDPADQDKTVSRLLGPSSITLYDEMTSVQIEYHGSNKEQVNNLDAKIRDSKIAYVGATGKSPADGTLLLIIDKKGYGDTELVIVNKKNPYETLTIPVSVPDPSTEIVGNVDEPFDISKLGEYYSESENFITGKYSADIESTNLTFMLLLDKRSEPYNLTSVMIYNNGSRVLPSYGQIFIIDGHEYRFTTSTYFEMDNVRHSALSHTRLGSVIKKMAEANKITLGIVTKLKGMNIDWTVELPEEFQAELREMAKELLESNFLAHFFCDNKNVGLSEEDVQE